MTGYTKLQSERLIRKIDNDLAKAEAALADMLTRVTDTGRDVNAKVLMREAHFRAAILKDTVRRRTR